MEQDVLQDIIDNSDFKFSRNGLSVRYNQMLKQYTNQAKMYGMTLPSGTGQVWMKPDLRNTSTLL